jgi:uncharacterized membrane protein YidH (DUF202 family)
MIEKADKTLTEARSKAIGKVIEYTTPKTISAVIEIVVACMAGFGVSLVSFGFDFSAFKEWSFYMNVIATTICIFMIYRGTINALFGKTEKRESVIKAKERYKELNKQKTLQLKEFLKTFNLETKIAVYIAIINKKIAKLEKKIMKTANPRKREMLQDKIGNDPDQEHEASGLKLLISEEYIKENIEHIYIKYPIVYYADFTEADAAGDPTRLETNAKAYDKEFNKYSAKKIWCYLAATILLSLSIPTWVDKGNVTFMASLISTLTMIVGRICSAIADAPKIYDNTITKSYNDRSYVLERFIEWKNNPAQIENEKQKERAKLALLEEERVNIRLEEEKAAKDKYKAVYEEKYRVAIEEYKKVNQIN